MSNRHSDPRRHTRVPMNGDVQWRSGMGAGVGEILDMSACGAAVKVPVREAFQVGPIVTLNIEGEKAVGWSLADEATVVHKMPENDGTCRIGIEFSAQPVPPDNSALLVTKELTLDLSDSLTMVAQA